MSQLLDQMRDRIRTLHYSIRTDDSYVLWAKQFILFHRKRHPLEMGEAEVGEFLTYLAVERNVGAETGMQLESRTSCVPVSSPLFNLLPYQLRDYELAVYAARLRVGGDVELASLEPDVPNLIATRPVLVPGNVDVMRDRLAVKRKGAGIRDHCVEELRAFLARQLCHIGGLRLAVLCENGGHAAIP